MKVIREGHRYELANFENKEDAGQVLQFIEKAPSVNADAEPGAMDTIYDGTTNEEVLEVLINRLQNLNSKFPCRENSIAITHLEDAQNWLFKRTRDREKRGVEGKHIK